MFKGNLITLLASLLLIPSANLMASQDLVFKVRPQGPALDLHFNLHYTATNNLFVCNTGVFDDPQPKTTILPLNTVEVQDGIEVSTNNLLQTLPGVCQYKLDGVWISGKLIGSPSCNEPGSSGAQGCVYDFNETVPVSELNGKAINLECSVLPTEWSADHQYVSCQVH